MMDNFWTEKKIVAVFYDFPNQSFRRPTLDPKNAHRGGGATFAKKVRVHANIWI